MSMCREDDMAIHSIFSRAQRDRETAGRYGSAQGGIYGNALQGASSRGHKANVKLLMERGTDVNARGEHYGSALVLGRARSNRDTAGREGCRCQ